jgi:hemin uptake protein HemP
LFADRFYSLAANEKRSYLRSRMRPIQIEEPPPAATPPNAARPAPERTVSTKELLGGAHRLWIQHAAERYLLQVTRTGKLILTK